MGVAPDMQAMMGGEQPGMVSAEEIKAKGTQVIERNNMMSNANLAQAQ